MKCQQFAKVIKQNTFYVERISAEGELIDSFPIENSVTNAAFNSLLDTYFGSDAKKPGFFIGLVDDAGFTAVDVADTMSSHAGWVEYTNYTETERQPWAPSGAANQTMFNSTIIEFTIGTVTTDKIAGLLVSSSNVKGGTVDLLWSTALFPSPAPLTTGESFRVAYALQFGN